MKSRSAVKIAGVTAVAAVVIAVVVALSAASGNTSVPSSHSRAGRRASAPRSHPASAAGGASLTVGSATVSKPIPPGFAGLSMEYKGFAAYAGSDPNAVDPVFEQLLKDIAPDQSAVLRIGGDSSDWSWWPVAHLARPGGIKLDLTPTLLSSVHAVATALDARLILGLNLEANSPRIAAAEADAMVSRLGTNEIEALELGNEPELYASFGWYKSAAGLQVPGRAPGWDFSQYESDFSSFARALPDVPLAGPSSGGPKWLARLGSLLSAEPKVRLATIHAYPLKHCAPSQVVTMSELLSNQSSHGLAELVKPYATVAAAHGVALRVDEMNGVSCGGYRGVSDAFGSALWLLDTLFEMAELGIDGINIHTVPNTINEILGPSEVGGHWEMRVHPEFYGMVLFAQAAPPGSRLLGVSGTPQPSVKVWATRGTDNKVRVVLINKNLTGARVILLHIAGETAPASSEQLRAASAAAKSGVTLGGQTFGAQTSTGLLAGNQDIATLTPTAGTYAVTLPAASATLVTVPAG